MPFRVERRWRQGLPGRSLSVCGHRILRQTATADRLGNGVSRLDDIGRNPVHDLFGQATRMAC